VVLHAGLSELLNGVVRRVTILAEFGDLHISLKWRDILPKEGYPVVFVMLWPICHGNMSEIEFSTLAAKLRICLIFSGRHS